jgi:hypothetical protein
MSCTVKMSNFDHLLTLSILLKILFLNTLIFLSFINIKIGSAISVVETLQTFKPYQQKAFPRSFQLDYSTSKKKIVQVTPCN